MVYEPLLYRESWFDITFPNPLPLCPLLSINNRNWIVDLFSIKAIQGIVWFLLFLDENITRSRPEYSNSYLYAYVLGPWSSVNFTIGALEERLMLSGLHTVADIFCCCCGQIIGWKYVILFLPCFTFIYLEKCCWSNLLECVFCMSGREIFHVSTFTLYFQPAFAFHLIPLKLYITVPGVCTWEEPKVQRGEVCSWKVSSYYVVTYPGYDNLSENISSIMCLYFYIGWLIRGRIVDGIDLSTEFYIESHASMSDAEDA